jgi:hypothetical protein
VNTHTDNVSDFEAEQECDKQAFRNKQNRALTNAATNTGCVMMVGLRFMVTNLRSFLLHQQM